MSKKLPSVKPFEDYVVYGPYEGLKGNGIRRMVTLKSPGHMTTMSYARYLVSVKEQRWLEDWEDADHIDGDPLNDSLSNLRVLSRTENIARNKTGETFVTLVCPVCEKEFTRLRRNTHIVKGGNPSKCSRSCNGKTSKNLRPFSSGRGQVG